MGLFYGHWDGTIEMSKALHRKKVTTEWEESAEGSIDESDHIISIQILPIRSYIYWSGVKT